MKKHWMHELARDLIALGGIPFLIITIIRVSVLDIYYPMQFIISACLFLTLRVIFKGNLHAGIGVILLIFTSLYYQHLLFAVFALLIYISMIYSLCYLGQNKKEVFRGIIFGSISACAGYIMTYVLFK